MNVGMLKKTIKFLLFLLLITYQTSAFSQQGIKVIPKNIQESLAQLDERLSQEKQAKIIALSENEFLTNEHFGLGSGIRNEWLYPENSPLAAYFIGKGIVHRDDMSTEILSAYYHYLKEKEPLKQRGKTMKHQEKQFTEAERALLAKAERLIQTLPERVKNRPQVVQTIIPEKQIITVQEAKSMGAKIYLNDDDKLLLLKGDVFVKGDIDSQWVGQQLKGLQWEGDLYGVMIDGDLIVAGDIVDDDYLHLQVTGNTVCDYFFSENGHQYIKGDLTAIYAVWGEYNDGSLSIGSKFDTPFIIANDHDMPRKADGGESVYIEFASIGKEYEEGLDGDEYKGGFGWYGWWYFKDSNAMFNPKVFDESGDFSEQKFIDMLKNNENPFVQAE